MIPVLACTHMVRTERLHLNPEKWEKVWLNKWLLYIMSAGEMLFFPRGMRQCHDFRMFVTTLPSLLEHYASEVTPSRSPFKTFRALLIHGKFCSWKLQLALWFCPTGIYMGMMAYTYFRSTPLCLIGDNCFISVGCNSSNLETGSQKDWNHYCKWDHSKKSYELTVCIRIWVPILALVFAIVPLRLPRWC